jgi:hypothetical protein
VAVVQIELDLVAIRHAQPLPDFEWDGDLPFAAYGAGSSHLYFTSLK